jgi:hypothetical protein
MSSDPQEGLPNIYLEEFIEHLSNQVTLHIKSSPRKCVEEIKHACRIISKCTGEELDEVLTAKEYAIKGAAAFTLIACSLMNREASLRGDV